MAGLRYDALMNRPDEVLAFTSLTPEEFATLLPAFETAFQQHMDEWRLDGKPRTARRYTTYTNCPLPTPADRLLFILTYLKTYALQTLHGRLFGLRQPKANQWIHVLLPVLQQTLQTLGDAPARTLQDLAARLGLSVAEVVVSADQTTEPAPAASDNDAPTPTTEPAPAASDNDAPTPTSPETAPSPLFAMTVLNGGLFAHRIQMNRRSVIAARKNATR